METIKDTSQKDYTNQHDWNEAQGRCLACDATDCGKLCPARLGRSKRAKARKARRVAELENALRELLMACTAHGPRDEVLDLFAKAKKEGWRVLNQEVQS